MDRKVIPCLVALFAVSGCGQAATSPARDDGAATVNSPAQAKLGLSSSAFQDGQTIPQQYSCDGANQSPPLRWGEPPPGTKSFALTIDDPDAPGGTFRHWAVFDMPATTRSLAAGQQIGTQGTNDKGTPGYSGPCPPRGNPPHHYHLRLFALDVERLDLAPNAKVVDVENTAAKHALGQGDLIGTYERR